MYVIELQHNVKIKTTFTCVYSRVNSFITSAPTRKYFEKYRAPFHSTRLLQQSLKVAVREYVSWSCFCSPDVWSPMMANYHISDLLNQLPNFILLQYWHGYRSLQQIYQQLHNRKSGISPLWCSFVINTLMMVAI